MKKLFIVDGYPKTKKQIQLLEDCIQSILPIGWDILLVSHCPVPTEIQEMVTYCIYDRNNLFVPPHISPHIYSSNDLFDFKVYLGGHALAITINMFNGFKFAQNYGYDFCYFMAFDSVLDSKDLDKLEDLVYRMESQDKSMIVFNPDNFIVRDCYYKEEGKFFYETLLFGAKVDQFLERFNPPRNLDEWMSNDMCYNLESCLYHKYKDLKEECIIVPTFVDEYLSSSKINSHRFGVFVCDVVHNEGNPESPILLINNLQESNTTKQIKIYINEEMVSSMDSYPGTWYYLPLSIDDSLLRIEILENEILESAETIKLSSELPELLRNKLSYIKFK